MALSVNLPDFPVLPRIMATFMPLVPDELAPGMLRSATEDELYDFAAREYGKSSRSNPLRMSWDVTKYMLNKPAAYWPAFADAGAEATKLLRDVAEAPRWAVDWSYSMQSHVHARGAVEAFVRLVLNKYPSDVNEDDLRVLRTIYYMPGVS